jgi:hypothetical protein
MRNKSPKPPKSDGSYSPPKSSGKEVDIHDLQKYTNAEDLKNMLREHNFRKEKDLIFKIFRQRLIKMSVKIYKSYFAQNVFKRIKDIFMEAAIRGYRKFHHIQVKRKVIADLKKKDGVPNFIKRVFKARLQVAHQMEVQNEHHAKKRKPKGFIGIVKKMPVFKKKILPKRKLRVETISAIPVLSKSTTILSTSPTNKIKIIRGKFSESSLKYRLNKKSEISEAKIQSRKEWKHQKTKIMILKLPQKHQILGLDPSVSAKFL